MAPLKNRINSTFHRINDKMKRHRLSDDGAAVPSKQPRTLPTDGFLQGQPSGNQNNLYLPAQPSKPSSTTFAVATAGPSFPASFSSTLHDSQTTGNVWSTPSPTSSMFVEYTHYSPATDFPEGPTTRGTAANPIDLTSGLGSQTTPENRTSLVDLTASSSSTPDFSHFTARDSTEPEPMDLDKEPGQGTTERQFATLHDMGNSFAPPGCHDAEIAQLIQEQHQMIEDEALARALQAEEESSLLANRADPSSILTNIFDIGRALPSQLSPSSNESELQVFGQKILDAKCRICTSPLIQNAEDVIERTMAALKGWAVLHSNVSCRKCKAWTCVGCGMQNKYPDSQLPHRVSGQGFKLAWCCEQGRLFLIWSLCCGLALNEPEASAPTSATSSIGKALRNKLKAPKSESSNAQSKGTGYGGYNDFGNAMVQRFVAPRDTQIECRKSTAANPFWEAYFSALALILPSLTRAQGLTNLDYDPPALVQLMLGRSPLLSKTMELLRNDSIEEIAAQGRLYTTSLDFVEALGNHTCTSHLIFAEQNIYRREEQLVYFSLPRREGPDGAGTTAAGGKMGSREKRTKPEKGQSMLSVMVKLATQCRHFYQVSLSQTHLAEFKEADGQFMLDMCRRICNMADTFDGTRKAMEQGGPHGVGSGSGKKPVVWTRSREVERAQEEFREWHRDNSVTDIVDQQIMSGFAFISSAASMGAMPIKGRMKKLAAQVSVLRTSLPEGIYVRHGSSRLDVMKILMIGPKGTPYENGLFEFDLFCPDAFPMQPPLMSFRTTGHGRVRFNPNLYEDGKVCLSLLGTWSGEPWNPERSTLLQVLVSIQGMIFNDEPYYNEPGRESVVNKSASTLYNSTIQAFTMKHAMIYWLKERLAPPVGSSTQQHQHTQPSPASRSSVPAAPPHVFAPSQFNPPPPPPPVNLQMPFHHAPMGTQPAPVVAATVDDCVWGEVIRRHFKANSKTIMETVKKWKDARCRLYPSGGLVPTLQEELTRHGFL